ncbi:MAG: trypsin-like peptidase domain-containing protein [Bacteroidota bacterium]
MIYFTENDSSKVQYSGGFFLNSQYFVTCRHSLYRHGDFNDKTKIDSIIVYYNFREIQGDEKYSYSKIKVDIHYKYQNGQYSFTKNKWDGDQISDFIVLKLEKNTNISKPKFDYTAPKEKDNIYSVGFIDVNGLREIDAQSFFLYADDNAYFMLGKMDVGFSGSPIYNDKGYIIGIVTDGIRTGDDWESFKPNFKEKRLIPIINKAYESGYRVAIALNAKYFSDKLNGFQ